MDANGQIGPEKGDYDTDVLGVAGALTQGATVLVALADRMTRYPLMLARANAVAFTADPEREGIDPDNLANWLYVAQAEKGAAWFQIDAPPVSSYVQEKLGYTAGGDGEVVAEFLGRLCRAMSLTVAS